MPQICRSPVLVGRRNEVARLHELVDAVSGGRGGTVLISGEAGIGKTRLVADATSRASDAGLRVLTGRAAQGNGTYRAIAQALASGLREHGPLDAPELLPYRSALGRLAPAWSAGTPSDPEPGPDPAVVLGEGVLVLLRVLTGGRGCVVVLEDLHWTDPDTLGLLTYLADAVAEAPVLLALTARDDESAPGVAALAAHPAVTVIRPARLDPAEVADLAAACRSGLPPRDSELRELVERSEGLPLLVEELLDQRTMSPTLAGLVAARLAGLAPERRRVLAAAAVVGGDPDWRLLDEITGGSEAAAALRDAANVGLLTVEDGRLAWRHALTREAVLTTLLPPDRQALAERAAGVLDERGDPESRATAAELFAEAGQPERTTEIRLELAVRDIARGALRSAADLLERADPPRRLAGRVAIERVRVLTMLGQVSTALEVGEGALASAGVTGDEHAELCRRLARAAIAAGRWDLAESYVTRAGQPSCPASLVLRADAAYGAGDMERGARLAQAAAAATEQAGTNRAVVRCEALLVLARSLIQNDLAGSAAAFRRAEQVAAEHGLNPWRVEALFGLGSVEVTAGDPEPASLSAAKELAIRTGTLGFAVQADLLRSDGILQVTGPRAALPVVLEAIEAASRLRLPALQASCELLAAWYAGMAGDLTTMNLMLDAAATRPHVSPEVNTLPPLIRAMPSLFAHDLPTAARLVDEGVSALLPHGSSAPVGYFGLWALLRTFTGDRDAEARKTLRAHHSSCAADNQGALTYAEAIAAGRAGRGAEAVALFTAADASLHRMPWWNRLLRLIVLEAAVADGWGSPVPWLRADLAAHEQAGELALARTCRDLLRTAGAATRRGRGASTVPPELRALGVTSREADVLALVAAGLTNAEVAGRLFLSVRTVETHVANLLAKTGASSRGELRAYANFPTIT